MLPRDQETGKRVNSMAHIPLRMCIACREMKPLPELIRVVAAKGSDTAELDIHKKKFGRGAYMCANADCIKKAEKKRCLERHLKCSNASELYRQAEELL